jgi:hypothetical protein
MIRYQDLGPNDQAVIRMMSGAHFGMGASIVLPSGLVVDRDTMRSLVRESGANPPPPHPAEPNPPPPPPPDPEDDEDEVIVLGVLFVITAAVWLIGSAILSAFFDLWDPVSAVGAVFLVLGATMVLYGRAARLGRLTADGEHRRVVDVAPRLKPADEERAHAEKRAFMTIHADAGLPYVDYDTGQIMTPTEVRQWITDDDARAQLRRRIADARVVLRRRIAELEAREQHARGDSRHFAVAATYEARADLAKLDGDPYSETRHRDLAAFHRKIYQR